MIDRRLMLQRLKWVLLTYNSLDSLQKSHSKSGLIIDNYYLEFISETYAWPSD